MELTLPNFNLCFLCTHETPGREKGSPSPKLEATLPFASEPPIKQMRTYSSSEIDFLQNQKDKTMIKKERRNTFQQMEANGQKAVLAADFTTQAAPAACRREAGTNARPAPARLACRPRRGRPAAWLGGKKKGDSGCEVCGDRDVNCLQGCPLQVINLLMVSPLLMSFSCS